MMAVKEVVFRRVTAQDAPALTGASANTHVGADGIKGLQAERALLQFCCRLKGVPQRKQHYNL